MEVTPGIKEESGTHQSSETHKHLAGEAAFLAVGGGGEKKGIQAPA